MRPTREATVLDITTLYRLYDVDRRLLYAGISDWMYERLKVHRRKKPWWEEVRLLTTEAFPTRGEAMEAEDRAIIEEQPLHNRLRPVRVHPARSKGPPLPDYCERGPVAWLPLIRPEPAAVWEPVMVWLAVDDRVPRRWPMVTGEGCCHTSPALMNRVGFVRPPWRECAKHATIGPP